MKKLKSGSKKDGTYVIKIKLNEGHPQMRKIEDKSEVSIELRTMGSELVPKRYMSPDYKNLYYDCGCGEQHICSQTEYILCARPVKFFFLCPNDICTLVKIKGIFRQTCEPEWCCDGDAIRSVIEEEIDADWSRS